MPRRAANAGAGAGRNPRYLRQSDAFAHPVG
jgi:hypothetical protein